MADKSDLPNEQPEKGNMATPGELAKTKLNIPAIKAGGNPQSPLCSGSEMATTHLEESQPVAVSSSPVEEQGKTRSNLKAFTQSALKMFSGKPQPKALEATCADSGDDSVSRLTKTAMDIKALDSNQTKTALDVPAVPSPPLGRTKLDLQACADVVVNFISEQESQLKERQAVSAPGDVKPEIRIESYRSASPCSSTWEQMTGTEQFRFCKTCHLNVYDFTDMDPEEVEELVFKRESRRDVSYFRRQDGKFLTQDCPEGISRKHRKIMSVAAIIFVVVGLTLALLLMPKPAKVAVDESQMLPHAAIPVPSIQLPLPIQSLKSRTAKASSVMSPTIDQSVPQSNQFDRQAETDIDPMSKPEESGAPVSLSPADKDD